MKEFFDFMNESVTAFHAVKNAEDILTDASFSSLSEEKTWKIGKDKGYFVKRNSSSLIAFKMPKGEAKGFKIFAAHTDSPSFRVKENTEIIFNDKAVRLNIEKYGGMILSSWLDRPLSVAGRVVVNEKNQLKEKLVNIDKDLLIIPNVAIHMNRDINDGFKYSVQNDMLPLFGGKDAKGKFEELIAEAAGTKKENILAFDLFLYSREKAKYTGVSDEFIVSPRLDDLACVYSGLKGFVESDDSEYIKVLALFDNEEVGSGTKQGADSTFLYDVLKRVSISVSEKEEDFMRLVAGSFLVSADNAHAVHPAAAGKADVTNRPFLNEGIVVKYSGNQRYATDAYSSAFFKKICMDKKIPFQVYCNNSDIAGGSTLGNISTAHVSLNTVDIGIPQYSMHSSCETMGSSDLEHMIDFAKYFYSIK
jgi:aspartyl aminopeptidase